MFEKQIYKPKRVQGTNCFNFFQSSNLAPLHNGLIKIVSVYNDIIKFFKSYYYKVLVTPWKLLSLIRLNLEQREEGD